MRTLLSLSILVSAAFAAAGELTVGTPAPAFKVETMIKGNAVDLSKGIHVVEFWATWCVPCKKSIPHLTKMAQKYKGKVDFTGISVWERGDDKLGQAKAFVASMGSKMDYNVAFDGEAKAMDEGFLKAAGQKGIPSSFLVKDGRVLWIGHPMGGLEKVIEDVLAGNYDIAKAKVEFERPKPPVDRRVLDPNKPTGLYNLAWDAWRANDPKTALSRLDAIPADSLKTDLRFKKAVLGVQLNALDDLQNRQRLQETSRQILADESLKNSSLRLRALSILGEPGVLEEAQSHLALPVTPSRANASYNEAQWILITKVPHPKPDYEAALLLIDDSLKYRATSAAAHDLRALALFKLGRIQEAIAAESEAIRLAKADEKLKGQAVEFETRLAEYRKAQA